MTLGSASESVTVEGELPPLDTESSTVGTVVEQRVAMNCRSMDAMFQSHCPRSIGNPAGQLPPVPRWGQSFRMATTRSVVRSVTRAQSISMEQPLNIGYINLPG